MPKGGGWVTVQVLEDRPVSKKELEENRLRKLQNAFTHMSKQKKRTPSRWFDDALDKLEVIVVHLQQQDEIERMLDWQLETEQKQRADPTH